MFFLVFSIVRNNLKIEMTQKVHFFFTNSFIFDMFRKSPNFALVSLFSYFIYILNAVGTWTR